MNKSEAIEQFLPIVSPRCREILSKYKIEYTTFVTLISNNTYNLRQLNRAAGTISALMKSLFPKRDSRCKPCTYVLMSSGFKYCPECCTVKPLNLFRSNKVKSTGLNSHCTTCHQEGTSRTQAARQAKYRTAKLTSIPSWADIRKIAKIYAECPDGYHVDHIIPLQGEFVCGLHVENNLQYLTAEDNIKKSNNFIE